MESVIPKLQMLETALEQGEWQTCIDCLKSLSTAERKRVLQNREVQNIPTLHYLSKFSMREEDGTLIDEIVKLLADSGCNINKMSCGCFAGGPISLALSSEVYTLVNCTALIAAAAVGNNVLLKCLIQNGARKDLLDSGRQSAFDWAISTGNLSCLKTLIYVTSPGGVDDTEQIKDLIDAYSLLHKAVDFGNQEIVAFLTETELCDPSKKAKIRIARDRSKARGAGFSNPIDLIPIQVAILRRKWAVAAYLISTGSDISILANFKEQHMQYTLSNSIIVGDFNSYELLLKVGDKVALPVLDAMLHLGIEKALNCTSADVLCAAVEGNQPDFVERIFNHYTHDTLNCLSPTWLCTFQYTNSTFQILGSPAPCLRGIPHNWSSSIGEYTLLHFACIHECSPHFVQKLVELGSDVNSKTTGFTKLTPLHISIIQLQWEHARILIENGADLQSTADFNCNIGFVHIIKSLNSIHLLLHLAHGCKECCSTTKFFLSLMDQEEKVSWVGVNELAIVGGSPECILKVLTHCAKSTPVNDLIWFSVDENPSCENFNPASQIKLPLLHRIFDELTPCRCEHVHFYMCSLIRTLAVAPYNYDFNSVAQGATERMELNGFFNDFVFNTPILFHALAMDSIETNNLLSEALLEYDHVELKAVNKQGGNPVEYVLEYWSAHDFDEDEIQAKVNFVVDTVEMLLFKGVDVASVTINEEFLYHNGLLPIIKLLCRAGATITPSFLSPRPGFEPNSDDIQSLKIWKDQFDQQCKFSLKHRCSYIVYRWTLFKTCYRQT